MAEAKADLAVRVPVEPLLQLFECSICFEEVKEAQLTRCGHMFCRGCLEECLNRRHECPQCKREMTVDDSFRDFHTEAVHSNSQTELLTELKDEYSKKRFDQVLGGALQRADSYEGMNPIETVFQLNLRESLAQFDTYYDELKRKYEQVKQRLRAKGANQEEIVTNDQQFQRSVDMIVEAYDKHMKEQSPSPALLPLRLILKVPSRNVHIDLHVPRTHSCMDLRERLIKYYEAAGNELEEFVRGGRFIIRGPLAGQGEAVGGELDQVMEVVDELAPLGKLSIAQGSFVIYEGEYRLRSDAPKTCFTLRYQQGAVCNYYTCRSCSMNCTHYAGVCEACKESCHADHQTVLAIADHQPTWACCYCPKKGACRIPNSRNKK